MKRDDRRAHCAMIFVTAATLAFVAIAAGETGASLNAILIGWLAYIICDDDGWRGMRAFRVN